MYVLYEAFLFSLIFSSIFNLFYFFSSFYFLFLFLLTFFFFGFVFGEEFSNKKKEKRKLTSGVLVLFNAINSPVYFLIVSPFCAPVFSPSFSSMRSHLDTKIKWE